MQEPDPDRLREAYALMGREPAVVLPELNELAERGSVDALVYLGHMYQEGLGTEADSGTAKDYFKRARDAGSVEGAYRLGRLYVDAADFQKAEDAFAIGVERNHLPSIYWMARILESSEGDACKQDLARSLYRIASKKGHYFARKRLIALLIRRTSGMSDNIRAILMAIRFYAISPWIFWLMMTREWDDRLR